MKINEIILKIVVLQIRKSLPIFHLNGLKLPAVLSLLIEVEPY